MSLDRKKRIVLFVVLTLIYFLFFNMFSFKVHALDLGTPYSLNLYTKYSGGSFSNESGYPGFETTQLTKFKISDDYDTEQDYEYNIVSNYTGQASIRAKVFVSRVLDYYRPETNYYFVFSVYSRLQLTNVQYFVGDYYGTNTDVECSISETVSKSDSPHYFYNFNCNTKNTNRAIYYIGIRFDNFNDTLFSPVVFGVTNFYSFSNESGATELFNNLVETTSNLSNEDVKEIDQLLSPNVDNIDSQLGGFSSSINSSVNNTAISGLVTLPITFLTGVSNAISGTCMPVNYIDLYDISILLPCPNLESRLGSVWTIIDTIFSLMLIYSIGKSLVKTFARLSDMDTNIMYECYSEGMTGRSKDIND